MEGARGRPKLYAPNSRLALRCGAAGAMRFVRFRGGAVQFLFHQYIIVQETHQSKKLKSLSPSPRVTASGFALR